jgi:hypothetical protein
MFRLSIFLLKFFQVSNILNTLYVPSIYSHIDFVFFFEIHVLTISCLLPLLNFVFSVFLPSVPTTSYFFF